MLKETIIPITTIVDGKVVPIGFSTNIATEVPESLGKNRRVVRPVTSAPMLDINASSLGDVPQRQEEYSLSERDISRDGSFDYARINPKKQG